MQYEEFKEKYGIGLSITVFENQIPISIWESLDFDQLLDIHDFSPRESSLQKKTLNFLEIKAITFSQLIEVYKRIQYESNNEDIMDRLWLKFCNIERDVNQSTFILNEYLRKYNYRDNLIEILDNIDARFFEWQVIFNQYDESLINLFSLKKLAETAETYEQILFISKYEITKDSMDLIYNKLSKMNLNFIQWSQFFLSMNSCWDKNRILNTLSEKGILFSDWYFIYRESDKESEIYKYALDKMRINATELNDLRLIH